MACNSSRLSRRKRKCVGATKIVASRWRRAGTQPLSISLPMVCLPMGSSSFSPQEVNQCGTEPVPPHMNGRPCPRKSCDVLHPARRLWRKWTGKISISMSTPPGDALPRHVDGIHQQWGHKRWSHAPRERKQFTLMRRACRRGLG